MFFQKQKGAWTNAPVASLLGPPLTNSPKLKDLEFIKKGHANRALLSTDFRSSIAIIYLHFWFQESLIF